VRPQKTDLIFIMAIKTKCQTPGAIFHTLISGKKIEVKVDLPKKIVKTEKEAKLLEANIHNALEIVLSKYF